MKIKEIEGDVEDIQRLFHEEGCDLASYIGVDKTSGQLSNKWIFAIVIVFFVLCSCIWTNVFAGDWNKVAILGVFTLESLIVGLIHYNFKNWAITIISMFFASIIICVALGVYSPQEAAKKFEQMTTKHFEEKVK